jgi:hypothetical protein
MKELLNSAKQLARRLTGTEPAAAEGGFTDEQKKAISQRNSQRQAAERLEWFQKTLLDKKASLIEALELAEDAANLSPEYIDRLNNIGLVDPEWVTRVRNGEKLKGEKLKTLREELNNRETGS